MATYQSGLLNDFYRRQGQRRSLTGLPSSYQETRGLMDPILAYDAQKTKEAGLLAQQQSQFDRQMQLQEKSSKDQQTAGMVAGVGQLAMLPMAYQSAKSLGWVGGAQAAPATGTNLMGTSTAAAGASTAQGAVGAAGTAGGAQAATVPMAGAAPYSATPALSYGAMGGEVGGGVGGTAGAEGAGLLGGAASWGAAGYLAGDMLSNAIHANKPISRTIKGATTGAAIGSVVPGIGTLVGGVIGGVIGAISSLF